MRDYPTKNRHADQQTSLPSNIANATLPLGTDTNATAATTTYDAATTTTTANTPTTNITTTTAIAPTTTTKNILCQMHAGTGGVEGDGRRNEA